MEKRIYLSSPHMGGEELDYIKEAFETNWIAPLGTNVNKFEEEVAQYVHAEHGVALVSGTSGIHLALKLLDVGEGDSIFCSTFTFAASCNPIIYEKATPVFIDSEYETWNMCPKALEKAFQSAVKKEKLPKAVIVVNLYGQSANYEEIVRICGAYNVPIIEDAAESLGATYKGQQTGTIGKYGIYSFNGNKIITTSGGGMFISDDEKAAKKVKFWATQAREPARHYEHKEVGYNYRMSNVVAGIGRGQLQVLQTRIQQKKYIFNTYKQAFSNIPAINMMPISTDGEPNYWLSCMTLEHTAVKPIDIIEALESCNIESRPLWKPMHLQPLYKQCPFYSVLDSGSVAEDLFERGICLPSDTKMSEEEIEKVIGVVKPLFQNTYMNV